MPDEGHDATAFVRHSQISLTVHLLSTDERDAALRAGQFAITLLKEHETAGQEGKRCPFVTRLS